MALRRIAATTLFAMAAALLPSMGCNAKTEQCTTAIEAINQTVSRFKEAKIEGADDAAALLPQLDRFIGVATAEADRLEEIAVEDATLKAMLDEYVEMTRDAAGASRLMKKALTDRSTLIGEAEKARVAWSDAQKKLVETCGTKRSCEPIVKRLKEMADANTRPEDAGYAKELQVLAFDLDNQEVGDEAGDTALKALVKAVSGYAKLVEKRNAIDNRLAGARDLLERATARETPLVQRMNGYCGAS